MQNPEPVAHGPPHPFLHLYNPDPDANKYLSLRPACPFQFQSPCFCCPIFWGPGGNKSHSTRPKLPPKLTPNCHASSATTRKALAWPGEARPLLPRKQPINSSLNPTITLLLLNYKPSCSNMEALRLKVFCGKCESIVGGTKRPERGKGRRPITNKTQVQLNLTGQKYGAMLAIPFVLCFLFHFLICADCPFVSLQ